ncbi:hypothetical protein GQF61_04260 [Sphingobacterium sp. DK4209]|uniref:Uncharacterized protein n=1 Tax=Sphingobacterium zhuxiongii TaxID=2662364 RepID=A0A5Q0Q8Z8_9SPHI|nr:MULTISPECIES: hypothetical protein [unclassified Sphingobacterium]MVZ65053.1 hypothetical protein [Sphingobacterium sp. DK4209]QGA26003.1 hypothetical protein GFH32_06590 [Sphingobacterium sp. dk4302]
MANKKKSQKANLGNQADVERVREPNRAYLNHVQMQARKMAELMGPKLGQQYIKDALKDWPKLLLVELKKFGA